MILPWLSGLARNMSFKKIGWCLSLLFAMAIANSGAASAAIIAQWTYEVNTPADLTDSAVGPTVLADIGTGTQTALHASANSDWTTPAGNGSVNSYSVNEWAVGDYFQFEVSTLGLNAVTLAWDQTSSSTGPGVFDLEYRVGNTGAFTVFLNDYVVLPNSATPPGAGAWSSTTPNSAYSYSSDLSAVTAINNQAIVQFRLTMATNADSTPPGTVATSGTSRVDNFTVNAVPEPSTVGLAIAGGLGLAGLAARRRLRKA